LYTTDPVSTGKDRCSTTEWWRR